MKHWQNENPVKSNISCENYTKNIDSYDKAEIFFKKIWKKLTTTHLDAESAWWPRTKLFILR